MQWSRTQQDLFHIFCFGMTEHRVGPHHTDNKFRKEGIEENPGEDFTSLSKPLHEVATSGLLFLSPSC